MEALATTSERPDRRWTTLPAHLVTAALVVAAFVIGGRLWFFSDDWNIFAGYHSGNLTEPFNGHLSLVPAGTYQLLFETFGVGSYTPYRVAGLAALAVLGFQVARWSTRAGGWLLGVLATAAVMWNSSGETNVLFPFLMNFSLPIAALVACWWHLDRLQAGAVARSGANHSGHERHLLAIGLWVTVALATSGLGVVVVGALALELVMSRVPWRSWLPLAVPASLWLLWWLANRGSNSISVDPAVVVPYALRMVWAGTTAIGAGWPPLGVVIAVVFTLAVLDHVWRNRTIAPRVAGALGAPAAFVALTALTRQDTVVPVPPDELRYGWTVGVLLVLAAVALALEASVAPAGVAAEAPPGRPGHHRGRIAPVLEFGGIGVIAAVVALGAVVLVNGMEDWTDQVADAAPGLRSNIYATEALGAQRLPPGAVVGPLSYVPVNALEYLDGVADVGSPLQGSTLEDIGGRPEQRAEADRLLFANLDLAAAEPEPTVTGSPTGCDSSLEVDPGGEVLVIAEDAPGSPATPRRIGLGRFDTRATREVAVPPGASRITLPRDAPVGTDAVVPYTVHTDSTLLACPIP